MIIDWIVFLDSCFMFIFFFKSVSISERILEYRELGDIFPTVTVTKVQVFCFSTLKEKIMACF